MTKQTALVICPGRGTYNKDELGYFRRHHGDQKAFIGAIDAMRDAQGQIPISELDGRDAYETAVHMSGENASALIYACAYSDFLSINRERYDVAAVCGNSMGWYISLACGGAASAEHAAQIVNTMGTLMHHNAPGGQVLYPFVDENWQPIAGQREALMALTSEIDGLYLSIELGGMIVFAGEGAALDMLMKRLEPAQSRFPLRLKYHGAFHTEMMAPIAAKGQAALGADLFTQPVLSLIDGRGHIWSPYSSDPAQLRAYTLGTQVCTPYNFTRSVQVGVKEFAPDKIIILGPGNTLGGAVAQSLIEIGWRGLCTKDDFTAQQKDDPLILSMGIDEQRALVI
ncbi:MAG: ACP S-malonyltransferase [Alphaproteobacteria bacterium]|nr:ACP S-malonyltransferase [Alphaproteobacteria bacterium]